VVSRLRSTLHTIGAVAGNDITIRLEDWRC